MALSTKRSRRNKQIQDATEPLITFRLRQHWFALPLTTVQRVITQDALASLQAESGAATPVTLIDIESSIFKDITPVTAIHTAADLTHANCLAILQTPQGPCRALPLDSQPTMVRVPISHLQPPSAETLAAYPLSGIIAVVERPETPLFLLDPEQL